MEQKSIPNYQNNIANSGSQLVQSTYMQPGSEQSQQKHFSTNQTNPINALNNSANNSSHIAGNTGSQMGGGYQPNHHSGNSGPIGQQYHQIHHQKPMVNQNMMMMSPFQNSQQNQQSQGLNNKFKTQRCWHFDNNGNCVMADKCHFAHGDAELRDPSQPIPFNMMSQAQRKVPSGPRAGPKMGQTQFNPMMPNESQDSNQQMGGPVRGGFRKPYTRGGGRDMNNQGHYSGSTPDGSNMNGGRGGYPRVPRYDYGMNQLQHQNANQENGSPDQSFHQVNIPTINQQQPQQQNQMQGQYPYQPQQVKPQFSQGGQMPLQQEAFGQTPQQVQHHQRQGPPNMDQQQSYNPRANPNFKTDICKFYEQRRQCPYLNRCSFAHGKKELRPKPPQDGMQIQANQVFNKFNNVGQLIPNGVMQQTPMPIVPIYNMTPQHHGQYYVNSDPHHQIQQPYNMNQYHNQHQSPNNIIIDQSMIMPQQPVQHFYQMYQHQQVPIQKQIVINTHDQQGKLHQRSSYMHSAQVHNAIKQASDFCEQGKVREAEQILQGLCGEGQILIRDETTTPSQPPAGFHNSIQPQDNK